MKIKKGYREEIDTMGKILVPEHAYFSAQTQRAVENFTISDLRFPQKFIKSLAIIKRSAAIVNGQLGLLETPSAEAISRAAQEVIDGQWADQFVVDLFQTGSGTSTNMNMNEVLASRANELLTGSKHSKQPIHPNDHVNLGQSSNDVIPSAIHITAAALIKSELLPALQLLKKNLETKSKKFSTIRKVGRTHLQDAVPMTLGQEFSGYARQIAKGIARLSSVNTRLVELAIGGTAVGTGLNAHPEFAPEMTLKISEQTGIAFKEALNHFEAQATQDTALELSGILKTIATSLLKIANDIRLLSSGPKCGLGEITIPSLQPGSSIMPGKVNPVIPEVVVQVAAQVTGNDATIAMGAQWGMLELNVMLPVIAYNLMQSIHLLARAATVFTEKCITGLSANQEVCESYILKSQALATYLIPYLGYEKAAEIAKQSSQSGISVPELVRKEKLLPENLLKSLF